MRERDLPERGIPEALARERAQILRDLRYDLTFAIPPERSAAVRGRAIIRVRLDDPHDIVLDFDAPDDALQGVHVGGTSLTCPVVAGHVVIPAAMTRAGLNEVTLDFTAGDAALNRRERLLYSLFVPARAHLAFPCFDQPDLKARFRLTLDVPHGWTAVANAREVARQTTQSGARIVFAETVPLPTYLCAFVAGELTREDVVRGTRTFGIVHDGSQPEDLARSREVIADLHAAAIEWLEQYTGIRCPFDPFDMVLVPNFQFRGMEHPGAILYDASRLLLPAASTQTQQLERATLIAHETAHMWFGNLVTMRWFSDVWMKEVFANLMAARIVEPAFPGLDHPVRFLLTHQPDAYQVDRTAGTNPIRQPLANLRDAGQLYGPIIYQKSVVALRQLEQRIGPDRLRNALREYLHAYAYANAGWPDLLRLLVEAGGEDLHAWSRAWIEERGRPEISTHVTVNAAGDVEAIDLRMNDPFGRDLIWPQHLQVALGWSGRVQHVTVEMTHREVRVPGVAGGSAPRWVLPGGELGYGLFVLDAASREFLIEQIEEIRDPLTRAGAWISLWENVLAGYIGADRFVAAAVRALPREPDEQLAERLLTWLARAYWRLLPEQERIRQVPAMESCLREQLTSAMRPTRKAAAFAVLRDTAHSATVVEWLLAVWRRDERVPGLSLGEADEIALTLELALRIGDVGDRLIGTQLQRTRVPERRKELVFMQPAVSPDPRVREEAFERLRQEEQRRREPWALQRLRYLNHPLRESHARRFVRPALDLLEEVQRTGDIFFPARWADASLWGHRSPAAATAVQQFLRDATTLSPRLRWVVLAAADDLLRAAGERPATPG